ncbi:oxidized purine nucleoside triphosphate hydrolase-like [Dysidea avara]|uniref:oxidized purine nucleoside triphosphate hydrolase-like n=1 Tax=Dysidea avara TaxID=196820 RepID=UPI00332F4135
MASRKLLTLVFIIEQDRILLGMKKRGFGAGWWNGFGGKVQQGETIEEAAKRELREECEITVDSLEEFATITFEFVNDPPLLEVHLFKSHTYSGVPTETEEMRPQWFKHQEIPFDTMWVDDKIWFPYMLAGKKFDAYFTFQGHHTIQNYSITERTSSS